MPLYLQPTIIHPGYATGKYYSTLPGQSSTGAPSAADLLQLYPFILPWTVTITGLLASTSAGGAGSAIKLGIWGHSANGPVGAPVAVNNTGAATTSAVQINLAASATLQANTVYWAGSVLTGTMPTARTIPSTNLQFPWLFGSSTNIPFAQNAVSMAHTYANDLPTIAGNQSFTAVASSGVPIVGFAT